MPRPAQSAPELPVVRITVERGKIREFALAVGDLNPVYLDRAAAQAAGYPDVIAPPTFATSLEMWGGLDFITLCDCLALDPVYVLHGEQSYEYVRPLYAGDEVTITPRVVRQAEKRGKDGSSLRLIYLENTCTDRDGEVILKCRSTVLERKEAAH